MRYRGRIEEYECEYTSYVRDGGPPPRTTCAVPQPRSSGLAFILASATPFALLRGVGGLTSSSRASSRICCCTRCCWR